eukprot:8770756-Prorocentrum_lima.AAC.1
MPRLKKWARAASPQAFSQSLAPVSSHQFCQLTPLSCIGFSGLGKVGQLITSLILLSWPLGA